MKNNLWIPPQLCTLAKEPFCDNDWIFEEKFDGIRCIAIKQGGKVSLYSRNHLLLNKEFPEIVKALEMKKTRDFILDGEVVAFDGKLTSFSKLQKRACQKVKTYYYVFDLLFYDKKNLTKLPLIKRKKLLKTRSIFDDYILFTPHIEADGKAYFKKACQKGLEGIIGKRADSIYQSKRTKDWLKFKCGSEQEFVIGGYTSPKGSRIGFGSLLIGYFDKENLKYAGKVGTGFDTTLLRSLSASMKKIETKVCPFEERPKEKNAHFIKPLLVCEVGFTQWTDDNKLRHPCFLGLREDKKSKDIKRE